MERESEDKELCPENLWEAQEEGEAQAPWTTLPTALSQGDPQAQWELGFCSCTFGYTAFQELGFQEFL